MKILRKGDRGYALVPKRGRVEDRLRVPSDRTREVEGHGQECARRRGCGNRRSSDGARPIDAEAEGSKESEDVLADRARKRQRQLEAIARAVQVRRVPGHIHRRHLTTSPPPTRTPPPPTSLPPPDRSPP